MHEKKYLSIDDVSKLLNINKHVIRYWDTKFKGLSIRLSSKKQRYFSQENIKKIRELKSILYDNGKQNNTLNLADKLISKDSAKTKIHSNSNLLRLISDLKIINNSF